MMPFGCTTDAYYADICGPKPVAAMAMPLLVVCMQAFACIDFQLISVR